MGWECTSEPKMPYFYLKKQPAYQRICQETLILPYQTHLQTHLGAENALFLRKKTAHLTASVLVK